ncbi:MAG: nucleoside-diphosphate sugar epimerase/dehydratase, partial [Flavobacteriales bacterium]
MFATFLSSLAFAILGYIRYVFFDEYFLFPNSVLLVEFLASSVLIVGSRFLVKLIYHETTKSKEIKDRVLIYGAGISGLITKRTIEKDGRSDQAIIGFIDDDKKLSGNRLEGKTIYHSSKLEKLIREEGVTKLIIAIQHPDKNNQNIIADFCIENNITVQKVPSTKSWINGEFSLKQISKIDINQLLGRKPIFLDEKRIGSELKGKIILVTGAAGS